MEHERSKGSAGRRMVIQAGLALLFLAGLSLLPVSPAAAATLDRVREAGKLVLGFRVDARPFSYQDASGKAIGYSIALCEKVAAEVKAELGASGPGARMGSGHIGPTFPGRRARQKST